MLGMTEELAKREEWRLRPWAVVLLVLMAIAFGVQLVVVGLAILTVATGVMVAGWTALLLMGIRKRNISDPDPGREAGG